MVGRRATIDKVATLPWEDKMLLLYLMEYNRTHYEFMPVVLRQLAGLKGRVLRLQALSADLRKKVRRRQMACK